MGSTGFLEILKGPIWASCKGMASVQTRKKPRQMAGLQCEFAGRGLFQLRSHDVWAEIEDNLLCIKIGGIGGLFALTHQDFCRRDIARPLTVFPWAAPISVIRSKRRIA